MGPVDPEPCALFTIDKDILRTPVWLHYSARFVLLNLVPGRRANGWLAHSVGIDLAKKSWKRLEFIP
eukprot:354567-Chlamydomonas_euryale.AAC.5